MASSGQQYHLVLTLVVLKEGWETAWRKVGRAFPHRRLLGCVNMQRVTGAATRWRGEADN